MAMLNVSSNSCIPSSSYCQRSQYRPDQKDSFPSLNQQQSYGSPPPTVITKILVMKLIITFLLSNDAFFGS